MTRAHLAFPLAVLAFASGVCEVYSQGGVEVREETAVCFNSKSQGARTLVLGTKGKETSDVLGYLGTKGFYIVTPEDVAQASKIDQKEGYFQVYRLKAAGLEVQREYPAKPADQRTQKTVLPYDTDLTTIQIEAVLADLKKNLKGGLDEAPARTEKLLKKTQMQVNSLMAMRKSMGMLFWANPGLNAAEKRFNDLERDINDLKKRVDELAKAFKDNAGNLENINDPDLPFKTIEEKKLYFYSEVYRQSSDMLAKAAQYREDLGKYRH